MFSSTSITKEDLIEWYSNQKLSVISCSKKFNCNRSTIYKLFEEYNIPLRSYNKQISLEILKVYYIEQQLSTIEIAKKFDCHYTTIERYLKKYNIPFHSRNTKFNQIITKEVLEDYYIKQDLSLKECREKFNCDSTLITFYLKKYNLTKGKSTDLLTKENLEEYYINQRLSTVKCGKIFGCTAMTVWSYLNKHNILIRTQSESQIGKKLSEEHRIKFSQSGKGKPSWNVGLTKETDERVMKISISLEGKLAGEKNGFYGKHHTEETKEIISKRMKGFLVGGLNPSKTKEARNKISISSKALWQDLDYIEKQHQARDIKPNKPESFLISLLAELYPNQWQYTGDFSYWINGKNPDFVNMEQKLVIEHFGDYWHRDNDPEQRKEIFAREGWDTLILWEHELKNLDEVIYKIKKFVEI